MINKNSERDVNYMPFIYKKYGIDSARFNRSNTYYISTIDEYVKLYQEVKDSLEKKANFYKIIKKRKDSLRKDSIRKLRKKPVVKIDSFIPNNPDDSGQQLP